MADETEDKVEDKTSDVDSYLDKRLNNEKKKYHRGRMLLTVISLILIVSGVGIIGYTLGKQVYHDWKSKRDVENFKAQILENIKNQELSQTPVPTEQAEATQAPGTSATPTPDITAAVIADEEFSGLELDENNDSNDYDDYDTGDRLKDNTVIGIIEIEGINIIYPIVEGTTTEALAAGICHFNGTAMMGEVGNCALAGHRGGKYGPYFKYLVDLKIGDEIKLTDEYGIEYTYVMYESFVVEPTEVWVIKDTGDNTKMLTLITCYNNGTQRYVLRARME